MASLLSMPLQSSSHMIGNLNAGMSLSFFPSVALNSAQMLKIKTANHINLLTCQSQGNGNGSCCGGSESSNGSSGSGSSCSSHNTSSVKGVGKEFEELVAAQTLREMEKDYETGPMQGNINRQVFQEVMKSAPGTMGKGKEERYIDLDQILAEANIQSNGKFVFEASDDEIMV